MWFIKYFSITCSVWNPGYVIQAFAKFKRPECTRLHLRDRFNLKDFPGGACARNSLQKRAVRSSDGHYLAHIASVYYISRPPLSQNPPSAPVKPGRSTVGIFSY